MGGGAAHDAQLEDAADALQDAFVSAYRNAGSFLGEAQVGTWLYRVTVNACLDRIRRAKARPAVPLPDYDLASGVDQHARTGARIVLGAAPPNRPNTSGPQSCWSTCTNSVGEAAPRYSGWPRGRSSPAARAGARCWPRSCANRLGTPSRSSVTQTDPDSHPGDRP